ncbi:MAG TPA: DUF1554 domain-containing protein [Candidatus Binatia bacterium]|nr:DUF1554 domain-containing protein [Candidatus Binatia bacterium]
MQLSTLLIGALLLASTGGAYASNLVFVTSGTFNGNLGGITGGDTICNALAANAVLSGTWVAWLSDASNDARDRLTVGGGPYVGTNGVTIAQDLTDLTDGHIVAISSDETNQPVSVDGVWTGTNNDGTWHGTDCIGWTSSMNGGSVRGRTGNKGSSGSWSSFTNTVCFSSRHLYCFQQ